MTVPMGMSEHPGGIGIGTESTPRPECSTARWSSASRASLSRHVLVHQFLLLHGVLPANHLHWLRRWDVLARGARARNG
jgi:hypothetical protein